MFTCRTFLYTKSGHVDAADAEKMRNAACDLRRDELAGTILLSYYEEEIWTHADWDYSIADIWQQLITVPVRVLETGAATVYQADCPAEIYFKEQPHSFVEMRMNWKEKKYWLPEKELMTTLLYGAMDFFAGVNAARGDDPFIHEWNDCQSVLQKVRARLCGVDGCCRRITADGG